MTTRLRYSHQGAETVFGGTPPPEVQPEQPLPHGCQRGPVLPEDVTEATNYSGSLIDDDEEQEEEAQEEEEAEEEEPDDDEDDADGGHDSNANQDKTLAEGCGQGTPSYEMIRCVADVARQCHCQSCIAIADDDEDEEEEEPEEQEEPEETPEEDEEPLSGTYGTGEEALDELNAPPAPVEIPKKRKVKTLSFKSNYGKKIIYISGTYVVEANILQFVEREKDADGYVTRFDLMAGLVLGPTKHVTRVWFGDNLIYSLDGTALNQGLMGITYKLYQGHDAQKLVHNRAFHDDKGFGRMPAYRGLTYLLMENISPADLTIYSTGPALLRVEVVDEVEIEPSLTYLDDRQYTDEFLYIDQLNNRMYGTAIEPAEWPEDIGDVDVTAPTKFINVKSWPTAYFETKAPYAVTPDGFILQQNLGINVNNGDYIQFKSPIHFEFDKYKTGYRSASTFNEVLVHRPGTNRVYAHTISKTHKCAAGLKYSFPKYLEVGEFLGFQTPSRPYSFHNWNGQLHVVSYANSTMRGFAYRIELPSAHYMKMSKVFSLAGTQKLALFTEGPDRFIILDFDLNENKWVFLEEFEITTGLPKPQWTSVLHPSRFTYVNVHNDVIRVDLTEPVFEPITDGPALPGNISAYWYFPFSDTFTFAYDNKMWTYGGATFTPRLVSLRDVYKDILEILLGDEPAHNIAIDVSAVPDILINGFKVDNSYTTVFKSLNELLGLEFTTDHKIQVIDTNASASKVEFGSDRTGEVKWDGFIHSIDNASLSMYEPDPPKPPKRIKHVVRNTTKPTVSTTKSQSKSFTVPMVATGIDFGPLLESHLTTVTGAFGQTSLGAEQIQLQVGENSNLGKITKIKYNPTDFTLDIESQPAPELVPAETLPAQHEDIDYLVDRKTQKNRLTPNILFMPALTTEHRSKSLNDQIAYTVIDAPATSGSDDAARRFHLPVYMNIKVRADQRRDVIYRRFDDSWRNNPWNGRRAAPISYEAATPIFTSRAVTTKSLGHQYAAHSGTVIRPVMNIPLHLDHRTTDNISELVVRFHHKNTITQLKNQTPLQLFNHFTNNMLVVGREYIQYQNFSVASDGRTVTFTGLHRAQRGTDAYTSSHITGEKVYLYTEDTFQPVTLNRLSTMQQPNVEMKIRGAFETYTVVGDAGSARPLAPLDIDFDYTPGETYLTVSWKGRSELFYNMLTESVVAQTKNEGSLGDGLTQGLHMVIHVLTRPFEVNNFERELIHVQFNANYQDPLIWYTTGKKLLGDDYQETDSFKIKVADLHDVGIYPEVDPVRFCLHYAYPTEQYERSGTEHMFKRGLIGHPAYRVMAPVAPESQARARVVKSTVYSVLTPQAT